MMIVFKYRLSLFLLIFSMQLSFAQEDVANAKVWNLEDCIVYALEHSPTSKIQEYINDSYRLDKKSATASFFPSVGASVGAGFNFGRSIDPATNAYNTVSTFNNSYLLSTSVPVFSGLSLIYELRKSKINLLLRQSEQERVEDELVILVMEVYIDILCYKGLIELYEEKVEASNQLLQNTAKYVDLGLKSKADLYEIKAQLAADEYGLIQNENFYTTAVLRLKNSINFPTTEPLVIDTNYIRMIRAREENLLLKEIVAKAMEYNPTSRAYAVREDISKLNYKIAKGSLFPSITFSAGASTNFFENMSIAYDVSPFHTQFLDNRGAYASFGLSIPVFSGFYRQSNVKRAKNNYMIAQQERIDVLKDLEYAVNKAVLDKKACEQELVQMQDRTKTEELAQHFALKKYDEGLLSSIDLQISSNRLLLSKANLLRARLTLILKDRLVSYYSGSGLY